MAGCFCIGAVSFGRCPQPTTSHGNRQVFQTFLNMVSNDTGDNQLRVTIVKYDVEEDEYTVKWSEVRGDGGMLPLEDADAEAQRDRLPLMNDGEEVIVIDAASLYAPFFRLGVIDPTLIESRVLTSPRFAPQIVWDGA